jgi:ABC-type lipoprotein release transport system permease subunit
MILVMAWRNIWRNKRRSLITMSSIAFAVLFACAFMSMQYGSMTYMVDNAVRFYSGHMQVQQQGYWDERTLDNSMPYSLALLNNLEHAPGVKVAVPRVESFALSAYNNLTRPAMIMGVDFDRENEITRISKKLVQGDLLVNNEKGILMSSGLAEYLKMAVGDTLVLLGQGYHGINAAALFVVKGLIKFANPEQNKRVVAMSLANAQQFYGLEDRVTSVAILMDDSRALAETTQNVKSTFTNTELAVLDWRQMMPEVVQIMNLKYGNSRKMIMILYAVIAFGMFGTFLMMTAERTREFGIMLAVGMRRRVLQSSIFSEITMMALLGVLAGIAMSLVIIIYFHFNPIDLGTKMDEMAEQYGMEMALVFSADPKVFFEQAWAVFVIAFILSFYPLLVLFRLSPVDAMRKG